MRTGWAGGFFNVLDDGSLLIGGATRGAGKELLVFVSDLNISSPLLIGPSPLPQYPQLDNRGQSANLIHSYNGTSGKPQEKAQCHV